MNFVQTLLSFLLALTILIFVHELGHYLVARWCGVKVLRFSIGFGKPLLTWRVGADRTEWSVSAIPLGGYVKMLDEREQGTDAIAPEELPRAFTQQPLGRRALIVAAGPVANFLLAIALYGMLNGVGVQEPAARVGAPPEASAAAAAGIAAGDLILSADDREVRSWTELRLRLVDAVIERRPVVLTVQGQGSQRQVSLDLSGLGPGEVERDFLRTLGLELRRGRIVVSSVLPDSAAMRAGLQTGDQVLSLDGEPVGLASAMVDAIRLKPSVPMRVEVLRGQDAVLLEVVPDARPSDRPGEEGRTIGRIGAGVSNPVEMIEVRYGPLESVQRAVAHTWDMSAFSLRMLGKMFTGELSWRNLSGPVSIADYAGQSARVGWQAYASFLALISVSLGVLNLLPIPVLDGGHLVYYALEAARGRPLSERFLELTQKAGLAVIAAMMVVALFNDITRLIGS